MILATSEHCGPCGILKDLIKKNGLAVEIREMSEHLSWFQSLGIRSVPTLVLDDGSMISGAGAVLERLNG